MGKEYISLGANAVVYAREGGVIGVATYRNFVFQR